jgi:hypothetical protein
MRLDASERDLIAVPNAFLVATFYPFSYFNSGSLIFGAFGGAAL